MSTKSWTILIAVACTLALVAWRIMRHRRLPAIERREAWATWRFRFCVVLALSIHALIISPSIFTMNGCQHDRPLGLPGGSGDQVAKGTPDGKLNATGGGKRQPAQTVVRARTRMELPREVLLNNTHEALMRRFSRDGMVAILQANDSGAVRVDRAAETADSLDSVSAPTAGTADGPGPLGLPGGTGAGSTAAGSPFGSRVGAKLWLYRVRYDSDGWDDNPLALPVLLREVQLALHVPVASRQETISLSELPKHRGEFIPSLLFMTGTGGAIATSEADRANLRDYLLGGGMLVADSSGGDFEQQFVNFISAVLPGMAPRPIEFDHEVFRGERMPYKLPAGCPIYREHGTHEARGIFAADGRLIVFLSPGDMGSAWAVVDLGRKRDTVEQAFQMGTNLVAYSLLTVHDTRVDK